MVIFDLLKKNAIKYPYKDAIIIDDIKLLYYSIFVIILLSFSSLFFSYISSVLFLFLGICFATNYTA